MGDLAVDTLFEATQVLQFDNSDTLLSLAYSAREGAHGHDFNLGLLCCLPKKAAGPHETMGEVYGPGDTRPLAIVNTDNRLIASAMRNAWEPLFNKWVSMGQRGFLKGRSMLMNVLDIDEAAMTISLKEKWGGLVLFDFKAAFPSVSHDFMFAVLEHIGLASGAAQCASGSLQPGEV